MPKGDGFEAALNHFQRLHDDGEPDLSLCHGMVTNGERRSFAHAWIEKAGANDIYVIDFSNHRLCITTKTRYYRLLTVTNVARYGLKEALIQSLKHQNFGPWDT